VAGSARPVALDLQLSPAYSHAQWQLLLGAQRMRFVNELVERRDAPMELALLFAWTLSECLIKLGVAHWPLGRAAFRKLECAHIGPALAFQCGPVRGLVTGLALAQREQPAALALALLEER
ncbi:MAG: hypothetical protein ACLGI6_18105, partial [Gammaproteobacteria bacterium]